MGSPCLFSPCMPVILSAFSQLRAKCSKLKQSTKFVILWKKNKTLSRLVCLGFIFFNITLGTCLHVFFNVCLHSRSFLLLADWRKSDSSVDGESQGNWRLNSNFRDVVANSSSFSRPAARAPRRACSQAMFSLMQCTRGVYVVLVIFSLLLMHLLHTSSCY